MSPHTRGAPRNPRARFTMQYYTKQELQGAGRYTGKCRIGNWNENDTMDEVRVREGDAVGWSPFGRQGFCGLPLGLIRV